MKHLHVLFVDDHADTRFVFSRLLAFLGHEVCLAATTIEALDAADHERPDLAIIDLGLPTINDGLALLQSMTDRRIRSVVCSGYGRPEDILAATRKGCLAFIIKPTTIAALVDGIDKAMSAPLALPLLAEHESLSGGQFRAAA